MRDQQVKQPKFSIIMTAFNLSSLIGRAIESVENQTLNDYELIIVDDYSTDDTVKVIKKYMQKYNNINLIENEENKKAGGARNAALTVATGKYILFLDGDDRLADNDVVEKLNNVIGDDDTDVIYLGFKIEGDREELVLPTEETCTKTYKAATDKYPNPWSKCWRREFLNQNNIRFPEHRFYEDVQFVYKGVMKSKSYKIADFVVHKYTSGRAASMTTTMNLKNIQDTVANLADFLEMRENDYAEEIDIILKKEIGMCKKRLDGLYETLFGQDD